MSFFNQIYPPESRTEESKLQSRLLHKLGLHSIQCSLSNLNPIFRRWCDPLYARVPRPCSQLCSHLRRRVRGSRKRNIFQYTLRNIFQHILHNIFKHILHTFHITSWSCCSFSAFISESILFKYLSSTYDPSIIIYHIIFFNSTYSQMHLWKGDKKFGQGSPHLD